MIAAIEAFERLKRGNIRFVAGTLARDPVYHKTRRSQLVYEQKPFATILGCSDSRVPAELIFDQGLGDLFVIRVAGNIVAPCLIGSVEYAAKQCGTRLVVVLGHSNCGAVLAATEELSQPSENISPNLASIVDFIRPSVEALWDTELRHDPDALKKHAVRANIHKAVHHLNHDSKILKQLINKGELHVIGAEYSLETGLVDFFSGVSDLS